LTQAYRALASHLTPRLTWSEAFETYEPTLTQEWPGTLLIDNAGIYGLYGVTPEAVALPDRAAWVEDLAQQLADFRADVHPVPGGVIDRITNLALARRAIDALKLYGERNIFLRGIVPQLGFDSAVVHYDRAERFAGETKYPLKKMLAFALEGVTSFSVAPLRAITLFGLCVAVLSFAGGIWAMWERVVNDVGVPGWASTLVPMFFLGGIQLLSLGVIGEYVAKTYMETKARPRFIIDREV